MATASKIKASEKQAICKKLVALLKKRYGGSVPKIDLPVMESLLFAVCLEDETYDSARACYDGLFETFHDLNEMRVSSIGELEAAFGEISEPAWRALRTRNILQYVFEKYYVFDFDVLKKSTLDLAARQLHKIPQLTPFVINWVMQHSLGGHLVPLDGTMRNAAVWLGLLESTQSEADGSEALKAAVRKSDTPLFGYLLKCVALDPPVKVEIDLELKAAKEEFDPTTAVDRLTLLMAEADSGSRRRKRKAAATRKKNAAAAKSGKKAASSAKGKTAAKKPKTSARKK